MEKTLLDTSFLLAYYNKDDALHARAKALAEKLRGDEQIITDYILAEFLNVATHRTSKARATQFAKQLLGSDASVPLTNARTLNYALRIWDKKHKLSFTDATLVAHAINEEARIATFDNEFKHVPGIRVVS